MEAIISLEAKAQRSKTERDLLAMNHQLLDVTKRHELAGNRAIGAVLGFGLFFSVYGGVKWYKVIHRRDNELTDLQLRKLQAEVKMLEAEATSTKYESE